MSGIFINYRAMTARPPPAGYATDWVQSSAPSKSSMDVDDIPPGADFSAQYQCQDWRLRCATGSDRQTWLTARDSQSQLA